MAGKKNSLKRRLAWYDEHVDPATSHTRPVKGEGGTIKTKFHRPGSNNK